LSAVASALDACEEPSISETIDVIANHVVVPGDTLSGLAYKYYRHANDANIATIFDANRDTLDDPNDLYVGWTVRIPRLAEQKS
jgi:nucleoid-associated protein YgaU